MASYTNNVGDRRSSKGNRAAKRKEMMVRNGIHLGNIETAIVTTRNHEQEN